MTTMALQSTEYDRSRQTALGSNANGAPAPMPRRPPMVNARATFHAADRMEPIDLHVEIIAESQPGLPHVRHGSTFCRIQPDLPTSPGSPASRWPGVRDC